MDNKKLTLSFSEITSLKKRLVGCLRDYDGEEKIKIDLDHEILEMLIFDEQSDHKCIMIDFELIKKLDLSTVSFDNVDVQNIDFTGSYGVKINPQSIYAKSLYGTKLAGVEIIGSFDDVDIDGTDFRDSSGAKIDPQTIYRKSMCGTKLAGVEIIGSFDGVYVNSTDFTGSYGAKVDPQKIKYKDLLYTKFRDAEIIGTFNGVDIRQVDFTGSYGAKIDPQTVFINGLFGTNLCDAELVGSLDGVHVTGTNFVGCRGTILDIDKAIGTDQCILPDGFNLKSVVDDINSKINSAFQKVKK